MKNSTWKSRRLEASNRISRKNRYPFDDRNKYFDEYNDLIHSKAENLQQFKAEQILKRKATEE